RLFQVRDDRGEFPQLRARSPSTLVNVGRACIDRVLQRSDFISEEASELLFTPGSIFLHREETLTNLPEKLLITVEGSEHDLLSLLRTLTRLMFEAPDSCHRRCHA